MNKIKLAYFGTPNFSAYFLEKLITDSSIKRLIEVKLVVAQPDRPVGRKQILTPSPVKLTAQKHNLKCLEIVDWDLIRNLKLEIRNLDLALVYAFAKIIPKEILHLPKYGFWNIHPSLLPKYRGPSPIAYPLINGDAKTGVTIIKMDEQIDHGPIIAQEELKILPTDRRSDLESKLTDLAFEMFRKILTGVEKEGLQTPLRPSDSERQAAQAGLPTEALAKVGGNLKQDPSKFNQQNHTQATYTKLLKKSDGFISFENFKFQIKNSPEKLYDLFRGLYPWPGIWTLLRPARGGTSEGQTPKRLKITDIDLKDGKIIIKKVQLEGKKEVNFETFNRAYKVF